MKLDVPTPTASKTVVPVDVIRKPVNILRKLSKAQIVLLFADSADCDTNLSRLTRGG
jgi:hypothetical protein